MQMPNITSSDRVEALTAFHRRHAALEGDDQTIVWHILADIIEWCGEHPDAVFKSFDEMVADVKRETR